MKKVILSMLLGTIIICLASCSSSQSFTVQGLPGTSITTPENKQLAVIDQSGKVKITMKRKEGYYHFLQAQVPGSQFQVPFALDYNDRNRSKSLTTMQTTGVSLEVLGLSCAIAGLLMAVGENEDNKLSSKKYKSSSSDTDTGLALLLGGYGVMALGALPTWWGFSKKPITMDYDYLDVQSINNDLVK